MNGDNSLGPLSIDFLVNNPELMQQLAQVEQRLQSTSSRAASSAAKAGESVERTAAKTATSLESIGSKAAVAMAGYFSLEAAKSFTMELINVRGQFQQIENSLSTILKSESAASELMGQFKDLTLRSPYRLSEIAESGKQLLAYGIDAKDVTATLERLGNVSAGVSQPLGDIAYLYGTIRTQGRLYTQDLNQFTGRGIPVIKELANQFNTTEDRVRGLVEEGKVGFPEMQKVFESLTTSGGMFYNLIGKQAETLPGQINRLKHEFELMLNEIGEGNEQALASGIGGISVIVENYQSVINILKQLIVMYGAYRAAVIATNVFEGFQAARTVTDTIQKFNGATMVTVEVTRQLTVAQALQAGAANTAGKAYEFLNRTMLGNPYVVLTLGIAAAAAAFYNMRREVDYAAKASASLSTELSKEQQKLNQLFGAVETTKQGTKERKEAVDALVGSYKDYLPKMDFEHANLKQLADAYQLVNSKISDNISLKVKASQTEAMNEDFAKRQTEIIKSISSDIGGNLGAKQEGRSMTILSRLINDAQKGSIRLAAGNNSGAEGRKQTQQAIAYANQITEGKDTGALVEYLNQLQIVIDAQRKAKGDLNAFYKGVNELANAGKQTMSAEQLKAVDFANKLKEPIANFDALIKLASSKSDVSRIKEAVQSKVDALAPGDDKIAQYQTKLAKITEIESKYGLSSGKQAAKQQESEFEKRKRIYEQLGALQAESVSKSKTENEREVDQVRAKYDKMLGIIDTYNRTSKSKIDPKRVTLDGQVINLPKAQKAAIETVQDRQAQDSETEFIKQDIDKKKTLYTSYEDFKQRKGSETANKEFADLLSSGKNYEAYLQNILAATNKNAQGIASGPLAERKKAIADALIDAANQNAAREIQNLQRVDDATETSSTKRAGIERRYSDDLATLEKNRSRYSEFEYQERLKKLAENRNTDLDGVRQMAVEESAIYRRAFEDITALSLDQLQERIAEARKALGESNLSGDARKAYIQQISRAEADMNARGFHKDIFGQTIDDYSKVAKTAQSVAAYAKQTQSSFNEMASAIAPFDEGLADTLSTIGEIAGVAGNAASSVASFASGDIVGGITSAISAVAGVFSIFGKAKESARKAAAELKEYQDALIKGEVAFNQLLRERARSQQDINKLTSQELRDRQAMLQLQTSQAQADYNRLLSQIQGNGQQVTGEHTEKYGGVLGIGRKTRVVQDLAGLNRASYEELEKLYTQGKLTDATKTWFEELKKTKDELDSIGQSVEATVEQLNRIATGTTASDIASAIADGFANGKRSVADFMDYFDQMLQKGLISKFENDFLKGKIDEFYKQYAAAASSQDGLTTGKITELRDAYAKIISDAATEVKNIEKVTGTSLTSASGTTATATGVQGAIKTIQEDTAGVIAGNLGGLRQAQMEGNAINKRGVETVASQLAELKSQTLLLVKIEKNTSDTAENTEITNEQLVKVNENLKALTKAASANTNSLIANGKIP